jgi:signal transduction histidine kinase
VFLKRYVKNKFDIVILFYLSLWGENNYTRNNYNQHLKRHVFYCLVVMSLLGTLLLAQQPLSAIKIDSVYVNDTLNSIQPKTLTFGAAADDIVFFSSAWRSSSDSLYFFWDGVDADTVLWRGNTLRYTNIKGGHYLVSFFQKEADTMRLCQTIATEVKYKIVEQPLFYPSLAFSLLLIFAGIIYLWLSYNFRQRMKVQNLRNRIAADLHDEVGSTLSSIAVLGKVLRRDISAKAAESLPVLDKILMTSKETIMSLRDTVWAINPDNDSFEKLMAKMRSYAREMILGEEIKLNYRNIFEDNKKHKTLNISMEQRRNVYLMFKECIHNIVKHSKATEVDIAIALEGDLIRIDIKDNGQGFDLAAAKDGNGLENLKRRAKDCFIELDIKSEQQKGTAITMLIPEL